MVNTKEAEKQKMSTEVEILQKENEELQ